ncbi:DNA damage-regulated autophagy modulator protein 1-like [Diadema antillarum]|uniref:DNA damage-regulated autophagy modulator protein 1-like n=1 Tax=Diadema antillarum TaxID=105358 RepID=UPI003A898414
MAIGCRCRCRPWFLIGLGWVPIVVGILLACSILIPYTIAVGLHHVPAGFPYISDSGTTPPESCLFGQFLNMTAVFGLAGIYIRYKQVELYTGHSYPYSLHRVNKICLVLGTLACLGMSLVANFQETNVIAVHFFGAFILFATGAVYGFLQAWLTYRLCPEHASIIVYQIRLLLSVVIAIFFVISYPHHTFLPQAQYSPTAHSPPNHVPLPTYYHAFTSYRTLTPYRTLTASDYAIHIVATVSEWIMAMAFLFYFFTFIRDFQKITLDFEFKRYTPEPFFDVEVYGNNIETI